MASISPPELAFQIFSSSMNPPSLLVRVPSKFELDFAVAKQLNIQPFKKTRTFSLHNVQKPAIKRVHPFSS